MPGTINHSLDPVTPLLEEFLPSNDEKRLKDPFENDLEGLTTSLTVWSDQFLPLIAPAKHQVNIFERERGLQKLSNVTRKDG